MIGNCEKNDHWHFAVEAANVEVSEKVDARAHKGRLEAESPAQIIGREDTVIDAFEGDPAIRNGH